MSYFVVLHLMLVTSEGATRVAAHGLWFAGQYMCVKLVQLFVYGRLYVRMLISCSQWQTILH